jgi:hypothetical protein
MRGFILATLFQQGVSFLPSRHPLVLPSLRPTMRRHVSHQDYSSYTNTTLVVPRFCNDNSDNDDDDDDDDNYPSRLHHIHVESLLTDAETTLCLDLANAFAQTTGRWESRDSERHASYATCDFPIDECQSMEDYLTSIQFDQRVFSALETYFGIPAQDLSYLDLFCAHYNAGGSGMDRLEAHRDGSILSFTITLTPPSMYQGGGTFFDALRDLPTDGVVLRKNGVVRPPRAGDGVLHCGKLLHGADVVTQGERTVLVGFVEVDPIWQRPGILGGACRDFGRMDVALNLHNHQQLMTDSGKNRGWMSRNRKWLSSNGSHLRGFLPWSETTQKRADPEFQRQKKLVAEDRLLRNLLMKEKPMNVIPMHSFEGDEITIL